MQDVEICPHCGRFFPKNRSNQIYCTIDVIGYGVGRTRSACAKSKDNAIAHSRRKRDRRAYYKEWRAKKIALGLCQVCGASRAMLSATICEGCCERSSRNKG